ncbi:MAG TPA: exodeoxyribonuclease VII small subunit [Opitutales bacterium]|nr:exodeoxyribonuclease VII small subunit [Opitutales bacterium]
MQDANKKDSEAVNFEDALERLEKIVEAMEEGEISLDDLLSKYEEGNNLLKVCNRRLRDAELKIELLKKNAEGETTVPLESEPS